MYVAHVITRLILGGAQENTLLTVEDQLRDYGDRVTLITGPALGPEGSLIERAERSGVPLEVLPDLRRAINPLRDAQAYRALCDTLRKLRPQLVHTHSSKAGILGRAAAAALGIPAVHTIHGSPFHPFQNRLLYHAYRWAEWWAARRCRKLISVCEAMTDQYVAARIAPRDKFVTVYSGMEVEPFLAPPRARNVVRAELGFSEDHVVIGKIARLFHLKGHADVIAAAERFALRAPRVRFLFVGDGLLKETLQAALHKSGLADRFVFTGLVPPERIPELIHAMDIVVHASYREGLARVLPQALIAGKPVVSYDIDGAKEVVIPQETGCLIQAGDITALAGALEQLANSPDMRTRFGQTGRTRFASQFRHQTMTATLRRIYEEVLQTPQ